MNPLFLLAFVLASCLISCQPTSLSHNVSENAIEEVTSAYTLKVERKDGELHVMVFMRDGKLYEKVVTKDNLSSEVGTEFVNIDHLFEIFKEKTAYEINSAGN